tara:strand:+ start:6744 stop:8474 length:1731 start_codon:yes stop_codon:yes gene_type:complete
MTINKPISQVESKQGKSGKLGNLEQTYLRVQLSSKDSLSPIMMSFAFSADGRKIVPGSTPKTKFTNELPYAMLALAGIALKAIQGEELCLKEGDVSDVHYKEGHNFTNFMSSAISLHGKQDRCLFGVENAGSQSNQATTDAKKYWGDLAINDSGQSFNWSIAPWKCLLRQDKKSIILVPGVLKSPYFEFYITDNHGNEHILSREELEHLFYPNRPPTFTEIKNEFQGNCLWGIDIASYSSRVFIRDKDGGPLEAGSTYSRDLGHCSGNLRQTLRDAHSALRALAGDAYSPCAIGLSVCGPYNRKEDRLEVTHMMPRWESSASLVRAGPKAILQDLTPGIPVGVLNDADAGAITEWYWGECAGYDSILYLYTGTGIGAGLVLNRHLFHGKHGFAGEIGRIRLSAHGPAGYGEHGTAEGFLGRPGIARLARDEVDRLKQLPAHCSDSALNRLDQDDALDEESTLDAAINGDSAAKRVAENVGKRLGQLIAGHFNLLDPDVVLLDGLLKEKWEAIERSVTDMIERHTNGIQKPSERVRLATCWNSGISRSIGAARLALDKEYEMKTSVGAGVVGQVEKS